MFGSELNHLAWSQKRSGVYRAAQEILINMSAPDRKKILINPFL